jgi:hypothetical protein
MGGTGREGKVMPFQRPTLTQLIERLLADMSGRMVGVDGAVLRRSVLGALARAEAGAAHELHGHLEWISEQVIIDTADAEIRALGRDLGHLSKAGRVRRRRRDIHWHQWRCHPGWNGIAVHLPTPAGPVF